MDRRTFLRGVAGAGASVTVVGLAGCSGAESDEFTLSVANSEIVETDDGYVAFRVTVSNVGNAEQRGTLYVTADLNGESTVRVREVALAAHATKEYLITYDVKMADVKNFVPSADLRPPEQ